jgi:hypothetical protein
MLALTNIFVNAGEMHGMQSWMVGLFFPSLLIFSGSSEASMALPGCLLALSPWFSRLRRTSP